MKETGISTLQKIVDKNIIETKSNSTIYKTTQGQRKRIEEGKAQIGNGEFFTNKQVEKEIDQWLNKE